MKTKLFVFDTSVLLQAMLSRRSNAYFALRKADDVGIIIVSDATLLELEQKTRHPKFDKYQSLASRLAFFQAYRLLALNIEPTITIAACRDPKDDKFLSLAAACGASLLVSSAQDLLSLGRFGTALIVTPGQFVALCS